MSPLSMVISWLSAAERLLAGCSVNRKAVSDTRPTVGAGPLIAMLLDEGSASTFVANAVRPPFLASIAGFTATGHIPPNTLIDGD
jgi:hypothetical protein